MSVALARELAAALHGLEGQRRLRTCPELAGPSRVAASLRGASVVSFCSNDYLGLASHPAVREAAAESARRSGFGAGASRLVAGDLPEHRALENALADLVALPAALLFPSGYQANLGVITALAAPEDLIASDAANHASIVDGCRLSRARIAVYAHADGAAAARALATPGVFRRRLIVTESLFSMDGDIAPLAALAALAHQHDASLIVDEAHALGVMGPCGRGLCAAAAVTPAALVGTLGKAFGAAGGFVAGGPELRAWLVNRARTFLFTTAPPPPVAAAAAAAVEIARGSDGDVRRTRLQQHGARLRAATAVSGTGPIWPVIIGADAAALAASAFLSARGLFVQAIRPPTVPEGTARLRVTLSAEHTSAQVDALARALPEALA